ncbi:MAG TPA: HD domain-containing protein [Anaerolineales bacterium]
MSDRKTPQKYESAYAGRWVARLQGKIVGQGGTPEAAQRAAQANRHKEKPEISYMPAATALSFPALLDEVAALAEDQPIFLVGGAVRDALLGSISHDFDLTVEQDAIGLARRVASALHADFYVLDEAFDAARVIIQNPSGIRDTLDFSSLRGADINADLEGRDFTINAIGLDLKGRTTRDPLQGAADLRTKTIRACSATAMQDDPVRILRGVRLAAALDFKIDPGTRETMKAAAHLLPNTSAERLRDELFRMLGGRKPDASIRAIEMLGVLPYLLPELVALKGVDQPEPHVLDVWEHTLSVMHYLDEILELVVEGRLENANGMLASLLMLGIGRYRGQIKEHFAKNPNPDRSLRSLVQFAALYHDAGKPSTLSANKDGQIHFFRHEHDGASVAVQRAMEFNLSNAEVTRLETLIQNHLRLFFLASRKEESGDAPSRRAIYHFFRDSGDCAVELILLSLADLRGTRAHTLSEQTWKIWVEVARELMENLWERTSESVSPPRLLDGHDLMRELDLEPGPRLGELMANLREAQAIGEVTTKEEALKFGRDWLIQRPT